MLKRHQPCQFVLTTGVYIRPLVLTQANACNEGLVTILCRGYFIAVKEYSWNGIVAQYCETESGMWT